MSLFIQVQIIIRRSDDKIAKFQNGEALDYLLSKNTYLACHFCGCSFLFEQLKWTRISPNWNEIGLSCYKCHDLYETAMKLAE